MNIFKRKLKTNRGATLAVALLIMLFCLVAGTVAISTATTNLLRNINTKEEQQGFTTVEAAALFIRTELESADISIKYEIIDGTATNYSFTAENTSIPETLVQWFNSSGTIPAINIMSEGMNTVNADVTLKQNKDININFSDNDGKYKMLLEIKATTGAEIITVEERETDNGTILVEVHEYNVRYNKGNISKG